MAQRDSSPKAFLGHGWAYPVAVGDAAAIAMAQYEEDVRQAILIILGTEKGERVMRPDFGAGLRVFLFEPITTTTQALIQHRTEEALIIWEPRIDNVSVRVQSTPPRGEVEIEISYRIRSTNTFYNLVYPFFIREGRA